MEGVDFRIRPVDQLLSEVAPFHQQPVNLKVDAVYTYINIMDWFLNIVDQAFKELVDTHIVLTWEAALLVAQQLHMPDVHLLHDEPQIILTSADMRLIYSRAE